MTTMTVNTKLWQDPRTGIWKLRKRIPERYRAVSGRTGDTVKISTGTSDEKAAKQGLARVLAQWDALLANWERELNMVALTPESARAMAAAWASSPAAGLALDMGGETSDVFEPLDLPECRTAEALARMWDRVEHHAQEAVRLSPTGIKAETWPLLLQAMVPAARDAYLGRDLKALGAGEVWARLNGHREPAASPAAAPPAPALAAPTGSPVSLEALYETWRTVTGSKPRTAHDAGYAVNHLKEFLKHGDASRVTREDVRKWREVSKANGLNNNTWNNRLSMLRQVFALAVRDGVLETNPADNTLRLPKSKAAERHPYSDDEARRILEAARLEASPARRWAHWIMAFTGMRVAEVLQLTKDDVRSEGAIWFLDVNEDEEGKSVKTGQRRHVPIHPALISKGLLTYVASLPAQGPLFPDKKLDAFGRRGGRGWNMVGQWVRETVKITDSRKAPNHSWRHRIEDEMRAVEVPEDARDAITGRVRKTTGRSYGVRGESLVRLHAALSRVPSPIASPNACQSSEVTEGS